MRTKTVTMDGADYKIAPLTFDQVDRYIENIPDGPEQAAKIKERSFWMVCWALNNALGIPDEDDQQTLEGMADVTTGTSKPWTPTRLRKEMDIPFFNELSKEILILSGLRSAITPKAEEQTVGESPAGAPPAAEIVH